MPVCHRALELADPKVAAVTIENDRNLRRPKYDAAALKIENGTPKQQIFSSTKLEDASA